MLEDLLNRILMLCFFLSCLNVFRHGYYFIQAFLTSTEETPVKYKISNLSLIILGISLSYILTSLVNGITL